MTSSLEIAQSTEQISLDCGGATMPSIPQVVVVVVVGILFHCIYLLSIFDIYFRSPLVHGMAPERSSLSPPAKRLVLFVADGLRADKFLDPDEDGVSRAPFLRGIVEEAGAYGVSHARVPTESRPGHVALIAGFYEDVSAVTKGWKTNPVEFDSVFNETQRTWSWGSPDILPMFGDHVPHVYMHYYNAEGEDFASDATGLDLWVFQRVEELFAQSATNATLRTLLHQEKTVFFLHLLGIDTNGHAYRPYSKEYLRNIVLVDEGIARVHKLFEDYFGDSLTAYIFTSDHGMSNKGSHGDGELANTQTPLVAWGAGLRHALPADTILPFAEHAFTPPQLVPTPPGLAHLKRSDVNQADVAPLMSCLLGLAYPMNSVGVLPISYLNTSVQFQAHNLFKNALQILHQLERKSELKRSTALYFRPFSPLLNASRHIVEIERALAAEEYAHSLQLSLGLISTSLQGLYYFQTYEWTFLMAVVAAGYLSWVALILCFITQNYGAIPSANNPPVSKGYAISVAVLLSAIWTLLYLESSPILYYAYVLFPILFGAEIIRRRGSCYNMCAALLSSSSAGNISHVILCLVALELMVAGYFWRELYSILLVLAGLWVYKDKTHTWGRVGLLASCLGLAVFPCLSTELENDVLLVCAGGIATIFLGGLSVRLCKGDSELFLVFTEMIGVLGASWLVYDTSSSLAEKQGLPAINQLLSWFILGLSLLFPFHPCDNMWGILRTIFLSLAAPYVLLSISYEALFYCSLGFTLAMWLAAERHQARPIATEGKMTMHDVRSALFFVLFCYVAFFGTGNIASISSFELSSTLRFMTVFRPFAMGALLLWKIFIPFVLVACTFRAINQSTGSSEAGSFLLVTAFSDLMTLHFFFLVQDQGSWKDIGTSISHFGISNLFIIFALVLLALSRLLMGKRKEKMY